MDIKFSKIKFLPSGGVKASMQITRTEGEEVIVTDREEVCSETPHPDFTEAMASLSDILAAIFEYDKDSARERFEARGIALHGEGEKRSAVVTGLFTTTAGQKVAVNTPRILLNGEAYDFEKLLAESVTKIEAETREYFENGKKAQLSIFGDDSNEG